MARAIKQGVAEWTSRAIRESGTEHRWQLPDGTRVHLYVRACNDRLELWVAAPTLAAEEPAVVDRARELIIAALLEEASARDRARSAEWSAKRRVASWDTVRRPRNRLYNGFVITRRASRRPLPPHRQTAHRELSDSDLEISLPLFKVLRDCTVDEFALSAGVDCST